MARIRVAHIEDAKAILKLVKPYLAKPMTQLQLKKYMAKSYCVILEDELKIVGVIMTYLTLTHNVIALFYLKPAYRKPRYTKKMFFPAFKNFTPDLPIYLISKDTRTFYKRIKKANKEQLYTLKAEDFYKWVE